MLNWTYQLFTYRENALYSAGCLNHQNFTQKQFGKH